MESMPLMSLRQSGHLMRVFLNILVRQEEQKVWPQ